MTLGSELRDLNAMSGSGLWFVITRLLVAWHVRVSTKFIPKVLTLK